MRDPTGGAREALKASLDPAYRVEQRRHRRKRQGRDDPVRGIGVARECGTDGPANASVPADP